MANLNPTTATAAWVSGMQNATQKITDGVNAVTVAPGAKAAAASALWLQRVQASQAKYAANVGAVTLQQWQTAMTATGIPRVASGATANQSKYQAFASKFFPYLATGVAQVNAMPKGTLAQSIARSTAMITYNSQYNG